LRSEVAICLLKKVNPVKRNEGAASASDALGKWHFCIFRQRGGDRREFVWSFNGAQPGSDIHGKQRSSFDKLPSGDGQIGRSRWSALIA
jgi:hypothetical protein